LNFVALSDFSSCLQDFTDMHKIDWVGGAPPVSEPACGFDGSKCEFNAGTVIKDNHSNSA
jgi:hypothetical protein